MRKVIIAIVWLALSMPTAAAGELSTFVVSDSVADNHLVRSGRHSAHILRFKGEKARLLFAFPAGNSGALLEFLEPAGLKYSLRVVEMFETGDRGHGVRITATFAASEVTIGNVVLGSVRELRQFIAAGDLSGTAQLIEEFEVAYGRLCEAHKKTLETAGIMATQPRESLNPAWRASAGQGNRVLTLIRPEYFGDREYRLVLTIPDTCRAMGGKNLALSCPGQQEFTIGLSAFTPYAPLTPIPDEELLNPGAQAYFESVRNKSAAVEADLFTLLDRARNSLRFLAYREKLLAGSFRFLTYFGRDTLFTARMLLPVAGIQVLEAAYASVIARMNSLGEVAHEESIGNQAIIERMALFKDLVEEDRTDEAVGTLLRYGQPVMDYKMVDDNFLLAPLVKDLLAVDDSHLSRKDKKRLLAGPDGIRASRLADNLEFVLSEAADESNKEHGVSLRGLNQVGNWRDSPTGLGGGTFPGDVNTFLVQSALVAIGEMLQNPLSRTIGLHDAIQVGKHPFLARAKRDPAWLDSLLRDWEAVAKQYRVLYPLPHTRSAIRDYVKWVGGETAAYFSELEVTSGCKMSQFARGTCYPPDLAEGIRFPALSLDWQGKAVNVMNTDPVFALFDAPMEAGALEDNLKALTFPFPLGLWTEVGPVVANPVYGGGPEAWKMFCAGEYHGTVVWGWVLGMLELAVMKQQEFMQEFEGGCGDACDELIRIKTQLAAARKRVPAMATSELWTWEVKNGKLEPVVFGRARSHATLSNAVQLWSTVWLSVYYRLSQTGDSPHPTMP